MSRDRERLLEIDAEMDGLSLASALRRLLTGKSWSQVKRLIAKRYVRVNGTLCLDEGRRMQAGDRVEVFENPQMPPPSERDVRIVYRDAHLIVVDKPAGMITVRRPEERNWSRTRKIAQPSLEEATLRALLLDEPRGRGAPRRRTERPRGPRLHAVHRLDRDTSGLMLFALSGEAQRVLVRMFVGHQIERTYQAVVHGRPKAQTITTWLVRDRGDGLRGSSPDGGKRPSARRAVTHALPVEQIGNVCLVTCRLETGRTHQIRIHLSEIGHRLCGEQTYTHRLGETPLPDESGAPRQALHSAELRLIHPVSGQALQFSSPLPKDLSAWLDRLRAGRGALA